MATCQLSGNLKAHVSNPTLFYTLVSNSTTLHSHLYQSARRCVQISLNYVLVQQWQLELSIVPPVPMSNSIVQLYGSTYAVNGIPVLYIGFSWPSVGIPAVMAGSNGTDCAVSTAFDVSPEVEVIHRCCLVLL